MGRFLRDLRGQKAVYEVPGRPQTADRVVAEYESKFPEGETGGRTGKSRGELDLSSFVHTKGVEKAKSDLSDRAKWDKEFFLTQMRTLRGWMPAKAEGKWDEIVADVANFADNGGPDAKNPERYFIPANLVGSDKERSSVTEYERKELQQSSKTVKNMKEDGKAALLDDTKRGFSTMAGVTAAQANTPLSKAPRASGSPQDEVKDMLFQAVGIGKPAAADQTPTGSMVPTGGAAAEVGGGGGGQPLAENKVDVRVQRNAMARKINGAKSYGGKEKALNKWVENAIGVLQENIINKSAAEFEAMVDRLDVVMAISGEVRKDKEAVSAADAFKTVAVEDIGARAPARLAAPRGA